MNGPPPTDSAVIVRTVTRDLLVDLTQDELAAIAKDIGRQNRERTVMEGQQKADAQRWKDKVIEMLKARGAKFPAFVPHKAPPPPSLRK